MQYDGLAEQQLGFLIFLLVRLSFVVIFVSLSVIDVNCVAVVEIIKSLSLTTGDVRRRCTGHAVVYTLYIRHYT